MPWSSSCAIRRATVFFNSVGNIAGYAAPQTVGLLRDISGSYEMPMMIMGAMVAVGGIIVPFAARLRPKAHAVLQRA